MSFYDSPTASIVLDDGSISRSFLLRRVTDDPTKWVIEDFIPTEEHAQGQGVQRVFSATAALKICREWINAGYAKIVAPPNTPSHAYDNGHDGSSVTSSLSSLGVEIDGGDVTGANAAAAAATTAVPPAPVISSAEFRDGLAERERVQCFLFGGTRRTLRMDLDQDLYLLREKLDDLDDKISNKAIIGGDYGDEEIDEGGDCEGIPKDLEIDTVLVIRTGKGVIKTKERRNDGYEETLFGIGHGGLDDY